MAEFFGRGSGFGHAKESTWGTAVSRTNWVQIYSCSLQERPEFAFIDHLSNGAADYADDYQTRTIVSGDLETPLLFEGMGLLLEAGMGAVPSTTGSGPYVHTFNRGTSFPGLTAELIRGNSGKSEILSGVVFSNWSLLFESGAVARFNASMLAKNATASRNTAGTATYAGTVTNRAMLGHHVGSITFASNSYGCQRIEISVDNKLERLEDLGSLLTNHPGMSGYGEVIIRATIAYRNDQLYNDYRAGTTSNLTFSVTSGADVLAVTARNCRIRSAPGAIDGAGLITQEIEFAAKSDSSNGALTFALTNGQSAYGTN